MPKQKSTHKPEIETKIYPINVAKFRKLLIGLGAKKTIPQTLMKRVVYLPQDNPLLVGCHIRVRHEGSKVTLSAKDWPSATNGQEFQTETELSVSSFEDAVKIVEATGLKASMHQQTKRETWVLGSAVVTIDLWPELRPMAEVECKTKAELIKTLKLLGYTLAQTHKGSALALYMKTFGFDKETTLQMLSNLTFAKNAFKDLPRNDSFKINV